MRPARRQAGFLAAVVVALLALGGCASEPAERTVRGILLEVRAASLQRLDGFTLRTNDGRELTFRYAGKSEGAEAGHPVSPGHLRQHMALAEPVLVTYREEGGELVAIRLADG